MKQKQSFLGNLIYAFGAQVISLILSILMSLIVPKLLGVDDYSYWQLFVFYIGYVGFSHFGLTDGIYLRIGGKDYRELDFSKYKTQLILSTLIQLLIAAVSLSIFSFCGLESNRIIVIIWTFIYMLVYNATGYFGYIFQAVNETKKYSISVMIDKALFIILVMIAIIVRTFDFRYFIMGYTASKFIALIYCCVCGKNIIFAQFHVTKDVIWDMILSITVGAKLLFANIASSLIIGIGRQIIDLVWGITAFGKFSFSLSLTSFFLQFIGQVSIVLFPALRQTSSDKQNEIYSKLRDLLGIFLPVIFIAYYPIKVIIGAWLPEYKESLTYIAILLPLCTYDGKMQMLCNTYFKVLRKENFLLMINIVTTLVSMATCSFAAYVLDNIPLVVYAMVFSIAFRSIVSEVYLAKLLNKRIAKNIVMETGLVLLFLILTGTGESGARSLVFTVIYLAYLIANKKTVQELVEIVMAKLRKAK